MSANQQERKANANSLRAQVRSHGYLDGLYGVEPRREIYPPMERFAYDAGYSDGAAARIKSMEPV